jgi:soluble lytic murein transglycosylase-like protein
VNALIASASRRYDVATPLVKGIVATESNFLMRRCLVTRVNRPNAVAAVNSPEYGVDAILPQQNIDAGTRYVRLLIDRYCHSSSPLKNVIAAYNAGFGALDRYHGIPPFRETQGYVNRVLALMQQHQSQSA